VIRARVADRRAGDARDDTEEAARSGRFPDDAGRLSDDSNPLEPESPARDGDGIVQQPEEAAPRH
jgi:hypothetical protein